MSLEYKARIDLDEDRWFQVEIVDVDGELGLEFRLGENPLQVSLAEREGILHTVTTAIEAILRYKSATP